MSLPYNLAHSRLPVATIRALEGAGRSPYDSQHHLFAIPALLQQLGLSDWIERFMLFLSQYDGIESYMEPEEFEPVIFARLLLVNECLARSGGGGDENTKVRIATALSNAPFASFGASWRLQNHFCDPEYHIVWQPLVQPFLKFIEEAPDDENYMFVTLRWASFGASPEQIQRFLLI